MTIILGIEAITDPLLLIAADVNNDEIINGIDLVELRKLILGIYDAFPENESYRFFDRLSVIESKGIYGLNEKVNVLPGDDHKLGLDFIGTKVGDVIGHGLTQRSNQSLGLEIEDKKLIAGERLNVPIYANDLENLIGFQSSFNYDDLSMEFVGINSGIINISENNLGLENEGEVTLSWQNQDALDLDEGSLLFELEFDVIRSGLLSTSLAMSSTKMNQEAYVAGLQTIPMHLSFNSETAKEEFVLYQNSPNPFTDKTEIKFSLAGPSDVHYSIYDSNGKVIAENDATFKAGRHVIILDSYNLNASGVMYLRMETEFGTATQKIILIK